MRWEGPIGFENQLTGDGRFIQTKAARWADLPIPLRAVFSDVGAHDGAVVVGTIDTIERRRNGVLWGTGTFDMEDDNGKEAARRVGRKTQRGISMDLDEMTYEIRIKAEILASQGGPEAQSRRPKDKEGRITVYTSSPDDEVTYITDTLIRSATIVAIPAFRRAQISIQNPDLVASAPPRTVKTLSVKDLRILRETPEDLVASAIPVAPPRAWFTDPGLTEPTPLTVTDDGRVFGHLAAWGTCHASFTATCVQPPSSPSGYTYFRLGAVKVDDGTEIPVGRLTMGALHAKQGLSPSSTVAHYEDTGMAIADVAAGEDSWGIWIAGSVRPGTTPEQLRVFRASPISGDWRRINGNLELVAALSVNVPGFPIPRPQALVASGEQISLVASGVLAPDIKQRLALERLRNFRADELARRVGALAPNQPRAPKGSPNGGQWVKGGSGSSRSPKVSLDKEADRLDKAADFHASKLLEQARGAEAETSRILQETVGKHGGELYKFDYRFKSHDSLSRKIRDRAQTRGADPQEVANGIGDALRYTALVEPKNYAEATRGLQASLEAAGHTVTSVDNFWANDDAPFHGVSMNVVAPNGLKWEFQVQTPEGASRAANAHFWYDFYRDPRHPQSVIEDAKARSTEAWQGVERPQGWETLGAKEIPQDLVKSSGQFIGGTPANITPAATAPPRVEKLEVGDTVEWGGYRFEKIDDGWEYTGNST